MRRIFALLLGLCVLFGLCGCRKNAKKVNSSEPSSTSHLSSVDDYEAYQTYTVDENSNIVDSKTGEIVIDEKLSIDDNGNIILKKTRQIVVTAEQVEKNKEALNTLQNTSQEQNTDDASAKPNSSSGTNKPKTPGKGSSAQTSNTESGIYRGTYWQNFMQHPEFEDTFVYYKFEISSDQRVFIYEYQYYLVDTYPYTAKPESIDTFSGVQYVRVTENAYFGYCVQQGNDMSVELCCYDGAGYYWMDDILPFQRIDNNSIRLASFQKGWTNWILLQPGAVLTQNLPANSTVNPVSPGNKAYFDECFTNPNRWG